MKLAQNLQTLRKAKGISQEELATVLNVSRQAIGKWESGQSIPELDKLLQLSDYFGISLDWILKNSNHCNLQFSKNEKLTFDQEIAFLIRAKKSTYAGCGAETISTRMHSHDLKYQEADFLYYDTYLGGERFCGEEAIWKKAIPIWCMNYSGRVIGQPFRSEFLKKALSEVSVIMPFRGPAFYQQGFYTYHCKVNGDFEWFQGDEEVLYEGGKIYECYFHGGLVV